MKRFLAIAFVVAPMSAQAATTTLFFDDFEAEGGAPVADTNFSSLANFDVVDGSVDLFTNGGFGLSCPSFACLDMDGSSGAAGRIETKSAFTFLPRNASYTLAINIRGNQRGGSDTLTFGIVDGASEIVSQSVTLAAGDGYRVESFSFDFGLGQTGKVFIDHDGGDNVGILLDSVSLTQTTPGAVIPLPAAAPLLLGGLAALGFAARRRG
jgi:hypothetical protein